MWGILQIFGVRFLNPRNLVLNLVLLSNGICSSLFASSALHLAVIHEHEAFLDSILQYTRGTDYLDIQNDLGQVRPVALPHTIPLSLGTLSLQ